MSNVVQGLFADKTGELSARKIALTYSQMAHEDDEVVLVIRRPIKDESGKTIGHAVGYEGNVRDLSVQLGIIELVKFAMIDGESETGEA